MKKQSFPLWFTLSCSALIVCVANVFTGAIGTVALGFMSLLAVAALFLIPATIVGMKIMGKFMQDPDFATHCAKDPEGRGSLTEFKAALAKLKDYVEKDRNVFVKILQGLLSLAWLFTFAAHGLVFMCAVYIAVIYLGTKFRPAISDFLENALTMLEKIEELQAPTAV